MRSTTTSDTTTTPGATTDPRTDGRPSLAAALLQAWRTHREQEQFLPVGPPAAGPWAGRPELDQDEVRVQEDLRVAPGD